MSLNPEKATKKVCNKISNMPIAYPPVDKSKQRKFSTSGILFEFSFSSESAG